MCEQVLLRLLTLFSGNYIYTFISLSESSTAALEFKALKYLNFHPSTQEEVG